jgi:hypothetical protein
MSARERPDHPAELTLLDYLMDQLPPEASDSIRRHVQACRACRRTIEDLEDTVVALDNLPTVAIPHDTPAAARNALRGRRRRRPVRLAIVAAALLAIAAALAAVGVGRKIGETARPPASTTERDQWFAISLPQQSKSAQARLLRTLNPVAPDVQVLPQGLTSEALLLVVVDDAHRAAVVDKLRANIGQTDAAAPNKLYEVEVATTPRSPDPNSAPTPESDGSLAPAVAGTTG